MALYHYCGADGKFFKGTRTPSSAYMACNDRVRPTDRLSFLPTCLSCPLYLGAEWNHYGDPFHDPKTHASLNSRTKRKAYGAKVRLGLRLTCLEEDGGPTILTLRGDNR